ncbi:tRNA glutamyl-Q(34) synthetase GluQRS [Roseimaritima sediminicola]|uniref:tRNA glutamyl-Q(34) synthetase GluQRS n=1 Tax=Roseimaritima sediminicola TaxID=2662066 RepID=UPI00129854EE|nr:tRNA glutamyl-Q(34) synthetase GluQRS [Roseimaritima sediminicola]
MPISNAVVGRLAPSPTGAQHLGNARTYLVAWLAARSRGGRLILRIEDIDSPRVKPWARQQALDDLRWLGLDWDEGPDVGGPHGPYVQTQRVPHYEQALQRLVELDLAYPCDCTRKDIEAAASAPHQGHEGPVYPGTCAAWRPGDALPQAGTFCWRYRTSDRELAFDDPVAGTQRANPARDLGDFPLTRKSGEAAYQLAVVVDDAAMGVTEAVRGDDLIPSTFRQLELFAALELTPPRFIHVPLVCGPDGRRLAKRHGDSRLDHYRQAGVQPERIIGWAAASLGLAERPEPIAASELVETFALDRIRTERVIVQPNLFG